MPSESQEDTLAVDILELGFAGHVSGLGVVRLTRDDLISLAASSPTVEVKVYGALLISTRAEEK